MRAVLSARSRKVPMRVKWKASSRSMVPMVTPRVRCERSFTHSTNWPMSAPGVRRAAIERASSQVEFSVSHSSEVSEPRTARAFSRAGAQAAEDAAAVVAVQAHEFEHRARLDGAVALAVGVLHVQRGHGGAAGISPASAAACGSSDMR